jgi:hypothetical protein
MCSIGGCVSVCVRSIWFGYVLCCTSDGVPLLSTSHVPGASCSLCVNLHLRLIYGALLVGKGVAMRKKRKVQRRSPRRNGGRVPCPWCPVTS